MYYKKEWIVIIIVLALLPLITIFSYNSLTGAAVAIPELESPFVLLNDTEEVINTIEIDNIDEMIIEISNESIPIVITNNSLKAQVIQDEPKNLIFGSPDITGFASVKTIEETDIHLGNVSLINASSQFNGDGTRLNFGFYINTFDLNNDNIDDVAIGSKDTGANWHYLHVFYGTQEGLPVELNVTNANVTFQADYYGIQYVAAGDANGDSNTDLLFGTGQEIFLWIGNGTISGNIDLETIAPWKYEGWAGGDAIPATFGKVNGDTNDDIIIGASHYPDGYFGRVHVFYGDNLSGTVNKTHANFTLSVDTALSTWLGVKVGDLNGDGIDDIAVGDPYADPSNTNSGQVKIWLGNGTPSIDVNLTSSANVTINPPNQHLGYLGKTMKVGDLNGDGFSDLVLALADGGSGSPTMPGGGVFVVFGSPTINGTIDLSTDSNITINGSVISGHLGASIAVGDYNRDEIDDLLIGASGVPNNGNIETGAAYLFYGGVNLNGAYYPSQANVTFTGINASDHAGVAVAFGDLNHDQFKDVIIGADVADPYAVSGAGETYIVHSHVLCSTINFNSELSQDLNVNGTCFTINNSNIVLNGNGYTINGTLSGKGAMMSGVENVTIKNLKIDGFDYSLLLNVNSNFNNFLDLTLTNSNISQVEISSNGGANNTFINVTLDRNNISVGTGASLFFKQYVNVFVNDTFGNIINSANITVYNRSNTLETSNLTSSAGIVKIIVTEFTQDSVGQYFHTNHTLNVSKSSFTSPNSQVINLTATNSTNLIFTLTASCGTINNDVSLSPSSLSTNGTCFTVAQSNILIDGGGTIITGNGTGAGINISSYDNITLQNIQFINFSVGILVENTSNSDFINIKINNMTNYDINISVGTGNNFTNISMDDSKVAVATGAEINVRWYLDATGHTGIFLLNGTNITIFNKSNEVESQFTTNATGFKRFILTEYYRNGSTIYYHTPHNISFNRANFNSRQYMINITQTNSTDVSGSIFMQLSCASIHNINESIVFAAGGILSSGDCVGLSIVDEAKNLVIDGNGSSIIRAQLRGITINSYSSGSGNNTIKNFNISHTQKGISVLSSSNNIFSGMQITNSSLAGIFYDCSDIYCNYKIENNTVKDSILLNNTNDVNVSSGTNHILINVTMNKNSIYSGESTSLYMKWYTTFQVNASNGSAISNVNISAYDTNSDYETSGLTDSNGQVRLTVTEFLKNEFGYTYITPHDFTVIIPGYYQNSTTIDISATNNTQYNFTLNPIICGQTITQNATLGGNMNSIGSCFVIGAENVTIDGNGYSMIGDGTGVAINLSNINNADIRNLRIQNYSTGISLLYSNDSNFRNIVLVNNSQGIFFNKSNKNIIYDSIISNNTRDDIFAINDGGTNNTFINTTLNVSKINVSGSATIFVGWYATVNVSFEGGLYPLQNANVTGYFNSTGLVDNSKITSATGNAKLELITYKKNATGVFYLTPHNVTAFFNSTLGYSENSTSFNLSNNTYLNLNLALNCVAPYDNLAISGSQAICPGTFTVSDSGLAGIIRMGSNSNVICSQTIIRGDGTGAGLGISGPANNITIQGCTFDNYDDGAQFDNIALTNLTIFNTNFTNVRDNGIYMALSNGIYDFNFSNFYISEGVWGTTGISPGSSILANGNIGPGIINTLTGIDSLSNFSNVNITGVSFTSPSSATGSDTGIDLNGNNVTIKNSTFTGYSYNIRIQSGNNNHIYENNFISTKIYHVNALVTGSSLNKTIEGINKGNIYDNYCGLDLVDSDNNGYADSGSAYPYNSSNGGTISTLIEDYAPIVTSCPSTTATGAGGGGRRSSVAATAVVETPAPTQGIAKATFVPVDFYEPEEAKKFLTVEKVSTIKVDEKITEITVLLQNNGTKKMRLFPEILQEYDDPFFIVHRKTVGYKGSFASILANIFYSPNVIAGRLLTAEILDTEEIILEPGEKLEKTLEIREGLVLPREMKIQFTSFDQVVKEETIELDVQMVTGVAVDLDREKNLIDIYAIIVPEEILVGEVAEFGTESVDYDLELNINKQDGDSKHSVFSDLFGPYNLERGKSFVFAQQLEYNDKVFSGEFVLETQINGVHNEFEIVLD